MRKEILVTKDEWKQMNLISASTGCPKNRAFKYVLEEDCPGCTRSRRGWKNRINLAIQESSRAALIASEVRTLLLDVKKGQPLPEELEDLILIHIDAINRQLECRNDIESATRK